MQDNRQGQSGQSSIKVSFNSDDTKKEGLPTKTDPAKELVKGNEESDKTADGKGDEKIHRNVDEKTGGNNKEQPRK